MFHTEQKCEIQMVTIASIILRISLEDTPATAHQFPNFAVKNTWDDESCKADGQKEQ